MITPRDILRFASYLAVAPLVASFLVIAWSCDLAAMTPLKHVGPFFLVALVAIEAGATLLAGWGSEETRGAIAAINRAGRMMVYAIPLGLCILTAVMVAGSPSFQDIALQQSAGGHRWLAFHDPFNLVACIAFFLAALACRGRATLSTGDLPALRHRGLMFILATVQASLWLGAWYDPFGLLLHLETISHAGPEITRWNLALAADVLGIATLLLKAWLLMRVQLFAHRLLPHLRKANVLQIGLRMLLPLACGNIVACAAYLWLVEPLADVQTAMRWVLTVAGFAGILALALFIAFKLATRSLNSPSAIIGVTQP